ncbi:DUF4893 domain-containing protein [Sphingomonas cavernae]|uniref:DUF4893 domain-containing protein n=1 Tax=Sphingomonas cavernae TaxID=2320861 RepID=A0A418WJX7_9SPHN|nr:DUF4893 domain-containing protein [Sphingomonas cavernae]RJF90346.1 DUF4893 domain-containing protein [Sphingomonas cavernae]
MRIVFAQFPFVMGGLALLGGCAKPDVPPPAAPAVVVAAEDESEVEWRNYASPADIDRLARLREDWRNGLAAVRPGRAKRAITALGALLDPGVALPRPAPPPGSYRCRVWRLPNSEARASRGFVSYKPFSCHVGADDPLLTFTKQSGSERPAGRIWPDGDTQLVFLGAMARGDEQSPPAYGDDAGRNLVGLVERVEPFRWRMVLPNPVVESRLDVIELVPLVPLMTGEAPS